MQYMIYLSHTSKKRARHNEAKEMISLDAQNKIKKSAIMDDSFSQDIKSYANRCYEYMHENDKKQSTDINNSIAALMKAYPKAKSKKRRAAMVDYLIANIGNIENKSKSNIGMLLEAFDATEPKRLRK